MSSAMMITMLGLADSEHATSIAVTTKRSIAGIVSGVICGGILLAAHEYREQAISITT